MVEASEIPIQTVRRGTKPREVRVIPLHSLLITSNVAVLLRAAKVA